MDFTAKVKRVSPQPVEAMPMLEVTLECAADLLLGQLSIDAAIRAVAGCDLDKAQCDCGAASWTGSATDPGTGDVCDLSMVRVLRVVLSADGCADEDGRRPVKATLLLSWPWKDQDLVFAASTVGSAVQWHLERRQQNIPAVGV